MKGPLRARKPNDLNKTARTYIMCFVVQAVGAYFILIFVCFTGDAFMSTPMLTGILLSCFVFV